MNKRAPSEREKQIAERVRFARRSSNRTLGYMASKLGISSQQYSRYELGENRIALQRLEDIAKALGAPIEWFFRIEAMNVEDRSGA